MIIFPKKIETVNSGLIDNSESGRLLRRELNINDTKTNKIYMIDISADRKWICYVSQFEKEPNIYSTTLSVHRFTAIKNESLELVEPATIFDDDSSLLHEIRIYMDASPETQMKRIGVNRYFDKPGHKFLSISPNGQYFIISTYDETKKNDEGSCFIFKAQDDTILFHRELHFNGRGVFLDTNNGLRLAIINTARLIIYDEVEDFLGDLTYEVYDLTSFGSTREDLKSSVFQYRYTDFVNNWSVTKNPQLAVKPYHPHMRHIIALSTYIKSNILITPFTEKSETIRFWSLVNNGDRLASLTASEESVIAISKDFKYAATAKFLINDDNVVKVHNLENGCLLYTLRSQHSIYNLTHATFCYDSRYLAVSAVDKRFATKNSPLHKNVAFFEIWHIESEKSIYSTMVNLGHLMLSTFDYTQEKSIKPFVSEEIVDDDKRILKGYYVYADPEGITFTRCLELKIADQKEGEILWLSSLTNSGDSDSYSDFDPFSDSPSVDNSLGNSSSIGLGNKNIALTK
ncbi:unnamed protein product [Mucor hiemalis]